MSRLTCGSVLWLCVLCCGVGMLRVLIAIALILFWGGVLCSSGHVSLSLSQAGASTDLELSDRVPPVTSSLSLGCRARSHC